MKLILSFLFVVSLGASATEDLAPFTGVYRGFSHTRDTEHGVAEIEVQVTSEGVTTHLATGHGVRETQLDDLEKLAPEAHDPIFAVNDAYRIVGFKSKTGYPQLYFLIDASTNAAVLRES